MEKFVVLLMEQNRGLLEHYRGIIEHYQVSLDCMQDMLDTYKAEEGEPDGSKNYLSPVKEKTLLRELRSTTAEKERKGERFDNNMFLPKHVSIGFILDYLEVSKSTFYRHIREQLLYEIMKIGNRPYYLMTDLLELFAYSKELRHGKGAWTFAKLTELRAKSQSLGPNK